MKLCTSISTKDIRKCLHQLAKAEMAELRLDLMEIDVMGISTIMLTNKPVIATCRSGKFSDQARFNLLRMAMQRGALYVDIDMNNTDSFISQIKEAVGESGVKLILSYHNHDKTPDLPELENILSAMNQHNPDLYKIITTVQHADDLQTIQSFQTGKQNLISFGMGEQGKQSRLQSLENGAPFTYVYEDRPTAPGQYSRSELFELIRDKR